MRKWRFSPKIAMTFKTKTKRNILKKDDEDNEDDDGFFVEHGYLSADEGKFYTEIFGIIKQNNHFKALKKTRKKLIRLHQRLRVKVRRSAKSVSNKSLKNGIRPLNDGNK
jgi:hypothetical protein